ncbi:MAG: DUF4260 domain-containing protein [Chitinophagaceae bacterium]|nr:DUF4260 domain-containing protein [Chitinophagaceae bacterium]
MKKVIALEEFIMFAASIVVLYEFGLPWWTFLILFLGPDISMLGYLAGNKVGAITYNLFHHKGIAILLIAIGFYFESDLIGFAGVILFGHSSMDRCFGYGLKLFDGFKFTHLGVIGKSKI